MILIFLDFWGFGEHVQVSFSLVFEFLFCWGILLGRVSFLFGQHKDKKPTATITARSLVDRGGGIWDFQHCIVITRGQEERIPKTASVVGKNQPSHNNNTESGGQRWWNWGFPASHRHHSGTGRKDTQNGKRCGN